MLLEKCFEKISKKMRKSTIWDSQNPPKTASMTLQRRPQPPKHLQNCCSISRFYTSAIFPKIINKMIKNAPRTHPKASRLRPTYWRHQGPSWAQLEANLAHLASILGLSSPKLSTESSQKSQEAPQTSQGHSGGRRGLQGSP